MVYFLQHFQESAACDWSVIKYIFIFDFKKYVLAFHY